MMEGRKLMNGVTQSMNKTLTFNKGTKTERWGFNCASFHCKTDLRKGALTKDWVKEWKKGDIT